MTSLVLRIVASSLTALVASCATLPEARRKLDTVQSCCNSWAEFKYEQLNAGQNVPIALNESSPVFAFESGKSYFKAFSLSPQVQARKLRVRSRPTGSIALETKKWSQVYCPQVTFLNEQFEPLSVDVRIPKYVRGAWSAAFVSEFDIPANTRYLVLHADPGLFGEMARRYTSGGGYMVGSTFVMERGGESIPHPCGPIADADVEFE